MRTDLFIILLTALLLSSALPAAAGKSEGYGEAFWSELKGKRAQTVARLTEQAKKTDSRLLDYYYTKYTPEEKAVLKESAARFMPDSLPSRQLDAVQEILSYQYVIYHKTQWHNLENNLEVLGKYEDLLRQFCKKYDLDPSVALGVVCWENSGNIDRISHAACVGLGQLSQGAVARAHHYGGEIAKKKKAEAMEASGEVQEKLLEEAESFDLAKTHGKIAKIMDVGDERLIPECNAEDTVVFLKVMMDAYGQKPDLAVSAYHNGVVNNDDLIIELTGKQQAPKGYDNRRKYVLEKIAEENLDYISLWSRGVIREMLCGWLTMDGEPTNSANAAQALGDESDIYPWKIMGAYGAWLHGPEMRKKLFERYANRWDNAECSGLPFYNSVAKAEEAIGKGHLERIDLLTTDPANKIYGTPELHGFIKKVQRDLQQAVPGKTYRLPFSALISRAYLAKNGQVTAVNRTHLQGIAFDCDTRYFSYGRQLDGILQYYYLTDRIYMFREGSLRHICINPRYGEEFLSYNKP